MTDEADWPQVNPAAWRLRSALLLVCVGVLITAGIAALASPVAVTIIALPVAAVVSLLWYWSR